MPAVTKTIIDNALKGSVVDVECHISNGLPNIVIVGFASKAVDEAKERIRGAFSNSGIQLPRKRITINLAPADIPKEGTVFDLPIAASILLASKQHQSDKLDLSGFMFGELSLDGSLRPIRGIIGKIMAAKRLGVTRFWIPTKNLHQAELIPNITLFPLDGLKELYAYLNGVIEIKPIDTKEGKLPLSSRVSKDTDFNFISGQPRAKRALEIAAAGHHNILLNGPPGTGKSMLAYALPSILPPLKHEEVLEVTQLHSLASRDYDKIIVDRPFRSPHHSSSDISIIGGGQSPRPGEISLSHHGVLLFDEFPEFKRSTIDALRQPLEDKEITVARAKDTLSFPANFLLVGTANPCPCGFYGTSKSCTCLPLQIIKYQKKLSGPVLDRIDLYIDVDEIKHEKLLHASKHEEPSSNIVSRVAKARKVQHQRSGKLNSQLTNQDIKRTAGLKSEAENLLNQASARLGLSARGYIRAIRVARTIADLENSQTIEPQHVSEALQYRRTNPIPIL